MGSKPNDILRLARAMDFAAIKHVDQKRKGKKGEPYIVHVTEVARLIAEATEGKDANLVIAALLHDTIEDTGTSYEELVEHFGEDVAQLVSEVTDDKSLPKEERKRLQAHLAPTKSQRARLIKIADKTANLNSILTSPPDWTDERKQEYFRWSARVVAGCRNLNPWLEAQFDERFVSFMGEHKDD